MELAGYSEIGAVLREAREDKRLSLKEVARMLHIRARYLEALESGDFSGLPGLPYAKGYIQAYAVFLDLDKDEVMRRFERIDAKINKRNFQLPKAFHSEKKPHQAAIWGSLSAVLVLYAAWQVSFTSQEKPISIIERFKPKISPEMQRYAKKSRNPACFHVQEKLYPPCHIVPPDQAFSLIPLRGKPDSILALWRSAAYDNVSAGNIKQYGHASIKQPSANQTEEIDTRTDDHELSINTSDITSG